MNYDELFKKDAFNNIDKETLEDIKLLSSKVQNKNVNDALSEIVEFSNNMKNRDNFSQKEQNELSQAILLSLPKSDQEKFVQMWDVINSFK